MTDKEFGQKVCETFDSLFIGYRRYSGRGMHGAGCVGVVLKDIADFGSLLVDVAEDDVDLARKLARGVCTDSMGCDWIFYWPQAECLVPDSDDE